MGRIKLQQPAWTYCPDCGELRHQHVLTVTSQGRPDTVECPVCGHRWTWPNVAEFERRAQERQAVRAQKLRDKRAAEGVKPRKAAKPNEAKPVATRICPICGAEFIPRNSRAVYCSQRCQETRRRGDRGRLLALIAQTRRLQDAYDREVT